MKKLKIVKIFAVLVFGAGLSLAVIGCGKTDGDGGGGGVALPSVNP